MRSPGVTSGGASGSGSALGAGERGPAGDAGGVPQAATSETMVTARITVRSLAHIVWERGDTIQS